MRKYCQGTYCQAFVLVLIGMTCVSLAVWGINTHIIHPPFQYLEDKQAQEDSHRVLQALEKETESLAQSTNDWAFWDDTFTFVKHPTPQYVNSNYPDPAIASAESGIDFLAVIDKNNTFLLQGGFHPERRQNFVTENLFGSTLPLFAIISPVLEHEQHVEGLVYTNLGLMLLAARPVLDSAAEGPSPGCLVMGRFLTSEKLTKFSEITKVSFKLLIQGTPDWSEKENSIAASLGTGDGPGQNVDTNGFLYHLVPSLQRDDIILLRSTARGDITATGTRASHYLTRVLLILACILFIGLAYFRVRVQKSQASLAESEERYRAFFANQYTVMLLVNPETSQIVDANPAASKFYGWSIEELRNKNIAEINTLSAAEITQKMEIARQKQCNQFHFTHRTADGTLRQVEVHSVPLVIQGKTLLYSIVHDITDRLKAELALKESHEGLKAIMNSLDSIIYIADMQSYELLFVNKQGLGIFGRNIIGKKCYEIFQGEKSPCSFCNNDTLVNENGIPTGICKWEFHNQINGRVYELVDQAIHWTDGQLVRLEVARDISERKDIEKQQKELARHLKHAEKVESLGRMASAVAHHYNNKLCAVIGNLDLAMRELPDLPHIRKNITQASTAAHRASEIGSLMLAYLGQEVTERKPVNLAGICRKQIDEFMVSIPPHIIFNADFELSGTIVEANEEQIEQLLVNLINNAAESIADSPGTITVQITVMPHQAIPTSHRFPMDFVPESSKYVCLQVKDTGSGITPENIDKIFDPFYSTRFTGRGLGLSVTMGILKAHKGCITINSSIGKGSTFRVFLPLLRLNDVEPAAPQLDQYAEPEVSGTVLLVEDEKILRELATGMLKKLGIQTLQAQDGVEALDIFKQNQQKICCIITDLTMPRMDGWETIESIRKIDPNIPFVLISGYSKAESMAGQHPEQPQVFLKKPYTVEGLKHALYVAMLTPHQH